MFDKQIYIDRRTILKNTFQNGRLLFLGNDHCSINFRDNWYPFRQDSSFLYYFGIPQPGLTAIIDIDRDEEIIFGDEATMDEIIWTGKKETLQSLAENTGINKVLPFRYLEKYCTKEIKYLPPYRAEHTLNLNHLLNGQGSGNELQPSIPFIKSVVRQRSVKSPEEIRELDEAATRSKQMHRKVMEACSPGMYEYELAGIAEKYARDINMSMSFPPILTINGQILHNHDYNNRIEPGQMLLFDGGLETPKGYAGDITRTIPVDKQFGSLQKDMYDIVHNAYQIAWDSSKPGILFREVHLKAALELTKGLKELNLMKGDPEEAVSKGAHTLFFQCGLGHMIGLDVHDMENLGEEYVGYTDTLKKSGDFGLKSLRLGRELEPGFAITIEPGIYIIPELIDLFKSERKYVDFVNYQEVDKLRSFGGIRIEDDFLVTESGVRLLGEPLANSSDDIHKIKNN